MNDINSNPCVCLKLFLPVMVTSDSVAVDNTYCTNQSFYVLGSVCKLTFLANVLCKLCGHSPLRYVNSELSLRAGLQTLGRGSTFLHSTIPCCIKGWSDEELLLHDIQNRFRTKVCPQMFCQAVVISSAALLD